MSNIEIENKSGEKKLDILIKNMNPFLNDGEYVFCTIKTDNINDDNKYKLLFSHPDVICIFKEIEGITLVLNKHYADKMNLKYSTTQAWITLNVHSSLDAVGLTAAVSNALANENISCNVIAAYYHDHLFCDINNKHKAMSILNNLTRILKILGNF